jgi:hypothetical protein
MGEGIGRRSDDENYKMPVCWYLYALHLVNNGYMRVEAEYVYQKILEHAD